MPEQTLALGGQVFARGVDIKRQHRDGRLKRLPLAAPASLGRSLERHRHFSGGGKRKDFRLKVECVAGHSDTLRPPGRRNLSFSRHVSNGSNFAANQPESDDGLRTAHFSSSSYPEQDKTGNLGYFRNRGSVADNWQK